MDVNRRRSRAWSVALVALAELAGCGGRSRSLRDHGESAQAGTGGPAEAGTGGQASASGEAGGGGSSEVGCELVMQGDVKLVGQSDAEALRGVRSLQGSLSVTGVVTDLSALTCLTEISGDFDVAEAPSLESLDGLEHLTRVGGSVHIGWGCDWDTTECRGNPRLRSIDALNGLTSAGGVYITANCKGEGGAGPCATNDVLERAVFLRLSQVSTLWIYGNPRLGEVRFDAIAALSGFNLSANSSLKVASFAGLRSVEDFFYVDTNPTLPSLTGLAALTDVPAGVDITHSSFKSLTGLEHLARTSELYLYDDPFLDDLSELTSLTEVSSLSINGTALRDLRGLEALTSLGTLMLTDNSSLASLEGLNQLERLRHLEIADNAALTSLHALASLEPSPTDDFAIVDNVALPTCEAEWLRDHIGVENIASTPNIAGNDDAATCAP